MTKFVKCRPKPINWLVKGSLRGHLHEVPARGIERLATPDPEVRAAALDHPVRRLDRKH